VLYAYFKKQIVPLSEAKVSIMTHALHYGTAVFEGIRGNWNEQKKQLYIFRMEDHYQRMREGSKLLLMDLGHSTQELCQITLELVKRSELKEDIYIRPLAYKSSETLGVRLHNLENNLCIFAIPWGPYFSSDRATCCVSTWRRPDDNVIPARAKTSGIYINNAFAKTDAVSKGFDEAIMLTPDGHVSEGSGENIFIILNGQLITPPIYDNILAGITRDTIITLAQNELGLEVIERPIDRVELYMAGECFLSGTAAHITPITAIDHREVGDGEIGKVTSKLQQAYFDVIRGNNPKYSGWCTPVY